MKITPELMSECVKYFKEHGMISHTLIMRKFKTSSELAKEICQQIEKRFPNLWREGKENSMNKMKV